MVSVVSLTTVQLWHLEDLDVYSMIFFTESDCFLFIRCSFAKSMVKDKMKFIYCVLFEFPTSYFFLLFLLDVMQQRRRIGQFFGNMPRHFLMTKFLFWSIMLESILDLAGKHALMLCSLELDLEHFKQLIKWEFQRYVELCIQKVCKPLLFNNSFQSVYIYYIFLNQY